MNKNKIKKALLVAVATGVLSSSFIIVSQANATTNLYGTGCTLVGAYNATQAIVTNQNCTQLQASILAYTTANGWDLEYWWGSIAVAGGNVVPKSVATAPTTRVQNHRGHGWYLNSYWVQEY
jgi:hypothetical protein